MSSTLEITEAQIAVHWKEEDYSYPPQSFVRQANLQDPNVDKRFALENFHADGKWRPKQGGEGGTPIDASVQLFDGQQVDGPVGLRQALMRYSPQFVRMLTEKMMTYALGRGVEFSDMPAIRAIVRDVEKDNNRFSALVLGVVRSAQFQMRQRSGRQ